MRYGGDAWRRWWTERDGDFVRLRDARLFCVVHGGAGDERRPGGGLHKLLGERVREAQARTGETRPGPGGITDARGDDKRDHTP